MFVCRHCGTKYTLEEARKLFIDGPVAVDGVASANNLLLRAKGFESEGDIDSALDYYNRVLDIEVGNGEAREGVARLERIISAPNLTLEFSQYKVKTSLYNVFIDGIYQYHIKPGDTKQLTVPYGEHTIGVGAGSITGTAAVSVTRRTRLRMVVIERKIGKVELEAIGC